MKFIILILALTTLGGCGYHRITDVDTGKTYYTTNPRVARGGQLGFTDRATGEWIVLTEYSRAFVRTEDVPGWVK